MMLLLFIVCANILVLAFAGETGTAKWTFEKCIDNSNQGSFDQTFGECFQFGAKNLQVKSCSAKGIVVDEFVQESCDGEPDHTFTYPINCDGGVSSRINDYECSTVNVEESVEKSEEWDGVTIAGVVIGIVVILVSIISCIICTRNNNGRTQNTIPL